MTPGRWAARTALGALLISGVACKRKNDFQEVPHPDPLPREAVAPPPADAAAAVSGPLPVPPPVSQLVAEARTRADAVKQELGLMALKASYVRSDGELDPKYGTLEVGFHMPHVAPKPTSDDPARPPGAPGGPPEADDDPLFNEMFRGKCAQGTWATGVWDWRPEGSCSTTQLVAPKCSIAQVWKLALEHGAPRDALAVIELAEDHDYNGHGPNRARWRFSIHDPGHDLAVDLELPDQCGIAVEAGPAGKPMPPLAELDDAAVASGVRAVMPAVQRCHATGAMAHVELALSISRTGAVSSVKVLAAPDTATGRCAAAALRTAQFPPSGSGRDTTVPLEL